MYYLEQHAYENYSVTDEVIIYDDLSRYAALILIDRLERAKWYLKVLTEQALEEVNHA